MGKRLSIISLFRDRAHMVSEYRRKVELLEWDGEKRVVCVEGDSKDSNAALLDAWSAEDPRVTIVHMNLGRPYYGSMVHPERFLILTTVANAGLERALMDDPDYVMFLESDILYGPNLARSLLRTLDSIPSAGVVAPHVWIVEKVPSIKSHVPPYETGKGMINTRFYDTWAFRLPGTKPFESHPPHPKSWYEVHMPREPYKIDTAGTVLFCKADVVRKGARFTEADVIAGFCTNARNLGYEVWTDPRVRVTHPT